jgi:hypothetical protein
MLSRISQLGGRLLRETRAGWYLSLHPSSCRTVCYISNYYKKMVVLGPNECLKNVNLYECDAYAKYAVLGPNASHFVATHCNEMIVTVDVSSWESCIILFCFDTEGRALFH